MVVAITVEIQVSIKIWQYLPILTDPFKSLQGTSEDEDDDFLKGETPQNDGVVGIAPNSYESNTRSPVSSIGSPADCYVPYPLWHGQPEGRVWNRVKIVCNVLLWKETWAQLSKLANMF